MIRLRPYREADRDAFVSLVTAGSVMRYVGGALTPAQAQARFDALLSAADGLPYARAAVDDEGFAGHGFLVPREEPAGVEIGFVVVPDRWGRGTGTAIARALVAAAFGGLRLPRLIATVDLENAASLRVLRKVAFADCGIRHDAQGAYRLLERTPS